MKTQTQTTTTAAGVESVSLQIVPQDYDELETFLGLHVVVGKMHVLDAKDLLRWANYFYMLKLPALVYLKFDNGRLANYRVEIATDFLNMN